MPSVVAHTGAYARTVTAVVTDAKGRPLAEPPRIEDLEVLEDGVPATLLAIEAVRPPAPKGGTPAATAARSAPGSPPADARRRVHQTLYLDTSLLRPLSVRRVCEAVKQALPRLLAAGPLEIVVANPDPVLHAKATEDAKELDRVLTRVGLEVKGKDDLRRLRREVADTRRAVSHKGTFGQSRAAQELGMTYDLDGGAGADPDAGGGLRMSMSQFIAQELVLVEASLARLQAWALSRPEISFGILFFANDGFDTEQSLFYAPKEQSLARVAASDRIPLRVKETAEALLRRGWVTTAVGFGATVDVPTGQTAEESSVAPMPDEPETRVPLLSRPVEPLRMIAETTGGDVVTAPGDIPSALAGLSRAFVLTYQTRTPRDGKSHTLVVRSRRRSLRVHAAETVAAGTPESAAATRAARVLAGEEAAAELPVALSIEGVETTPEGKTRGRLKTRVELGGLKELLARLGGGRLRVTVLVRVEGGEAKPHHEEIALPASGFADVWALKTSLVWPPEATTVAVVVEELSTGLWGSGVTRLVETPAAPAPVEAAAPGAPAPGPSAPSTPEPETGRSASMAILTFVSGLVTGPITVNADLGPAESAELLLDGRPACALTRAARGCALPLGPALAVHRLDLVRRDAKGEVAERVTRWINRPGSSDAELRGRLTCDEGPKGSAPCLVRFGWIHPDGLDPDAWRVTLDGNAVSRRPEKGFTLMVPGDGKTHVVSAEANFPDGSTAALARVLGPDRAEETGDALQAVPLEVRGKGEPAASEIAAMLDAPVPVLEKGGSQVVLVLDPVASSKLLELQNEALGKSFPGITTGKLKGVLSDLGPMRVVHPETSGLRVPTFSLPATGQERLEALLYGPRGAASGVYAPADAVAAAGVLAASSQARRAVLLVLGEPRADRSRFPVADVRAYLAELMVPLFVLSTGSSAGAWGDATPIRSQADLRRALEDVVASLERQRVAWIAGDRAPADIAPRDPSGRVSLAGRPAR